MLLEVLRPFVAYFNSRPSARGDCRTACLRQKHADFNSRPSARGDAHAPRRRHDGRYFNSRPSARGDLAALFRLMRVIFQFTPLREGRRGQPGAGVHPPHFNSRPSARGDLSAAACIGALSYFNSRPSARGDSKRYAISANLLFNPYKSAWLNNNATQFVEIILVIFHRIIA